MTTGIKLTLLGGFSLTSDDGAEVRLPAGKGQALLAYLALNPDEAHSRGKLAELLWGDQDEDHARANLSQCLFRLRKALGESAEEIFETDKERIRLNGARLDVDALTLRRLADSDIPGATALCTGPLLDSLATRQEGFEEWLSGERDVYARLMERVLTRQAEGRLTAGDTEAAIEVARCLVAMNTFNEAAHRMLIRAYAAAGQRYAALQQYRACAEVLRCELDATPDAETTKLHGEIQRQPGETGVTAPELKSPRSSRPSIAVLPFTNLSDDAEQEYFADGMADDLITDMSRVSGLVIASRTSSFAYKGKNQKTQEIASDLDVRYLIEGSVRRVGDQLRINAQLVDGQSGMHLWAETFDRAYENIFALQDEVTGKIVSALKVSLTPDERERLARPPTTEIEAYDYFLKAEKLRHKAHWLTIEPAYEYYDQALALDPDFLEAHIGHAYASFQSWHLSWYAAIDPLEAKRRTLDSLGRALELDSANADALALKAEIQIWLRENDLALEFANDAVRIHPESPELLVTRALGLTTLGRTDEAQADLARAEAVVEKPSPQVLRQMLEVHVMLANYEEAVALGLQYGDEDSPFLHRGAIQLAAAYAGLDQLSKAKGELEKLRESWAWASLAWSRMRLLHYREDIRDRYIGQLKKAGMPEWPYNFQGDPAQRLTTTDLKALFFNGPILWHRISPRLTHNTTGRYDGKGNYTLPNKTRSGKEIHVSGTITVKNDMLCSRSESTNLGREICSEVYRNPDGSAEEHNEYFSISFWGKSFFSIEPIADEDRLGA